MNFFHHKHLGNHLLQLCPKVVKHPVYSELGHLQDKICLEEQQQQRIEKHDKVCAQRHFNICNEIGLN